jgi:AraC-like DNA-binding protein
LKDQALYEIPCLQDKMFPISISCCTFEKHGNVFPNHWHDHIEFLYVKNGNGIFECNSVPYHVKSGDLVIVNSGELHCGYSISDVFSYYFIIVNPALLQSSFIDTCDIKYIAPITQNLIMFKNLINNDIAIMDCINRIIDEYDSKRMGYELSIKSDVYRTLVLLMRDHIRNILETNVYDSKKREMERLRPVFDYIEENYDEKITGLYLSKMINISHYHFCHIFKEITNKTVTEYINVIRINKAIDLLFDTSMNITEVALATGFNDINYFIRQFKKYMDIPPSAFRIKYLKK